MQRTLTGAALLAFLLAAATAPAAEPSDAAAHAQDAHATEGSHASGGQDDGHGESHGPPLVPKLFNTLLFFGALGWFAGPWIVAQMRTRKAQIASDLSAAQRAREEAEAKLAEMEARLAQVDGEVERILETAGRQAEAERARLLAAAGQEAERILQSAEVQVGELEVQASRRLREQAATHAVTLARGLVEKQLGDADRAKLFDDYLSGLGKAAG